MCSDYEQHVRWAEYCKMMQDLELGIPTRQSELDLPEVDDIKINDVGPVMRGAGNGIELVPMKFSFPPSGGAVRCSISDLRGGVSTRATAASFRPAPSSSILPRAGQQVGPGLLVARAIGPIDQTKQLVVGMFGVFAGEPDDVIERKCPAKLDFGAARTLAIKERAPSAFDANGAAPVGAQLNPCVFNALSQVRCARPSADRDMSGKKQRGEVGTGERVSGGPVRLKRVDAPTRRTRPRPPSERS
jgi:hypothetical protein